MNNPFLKRIMHDRKEDVIHSSTYASAQNQGIGSASTISFSERQRIEQNRTNIQSYRDAKLVRDSLGNGPKAKTIAEIKQNNSPDVTLKQKLDGASTISTAGTSSKSSSRTYTPNIKPDIKPKF